MKKNLVRIAATGMALTMMLAGASALTGCLKQPVQNGTVNETVTEAETLEEVIGTLGGYTNEVIGIGISDDLQKIFGEATAEFVGSVLTPEALLGTQIINGVRYFILCDVTVMTADGNHKQAIVSITESSDGTITLEGINELDLNNLADIEDASETVGGFVVNDAELHAEFPESAQKALEKALQTFVGSNVEAMAYMGSQIVNGTNYRFICRVSDIQTGAAKLSLVTVYEDLDGNAEISDMKQIDPLAVMTDGELIEDEVPETGGDCDIFVGGKVGAYTNEMIGNGLPDDLKAAFEQAFTEFVGSELTPVSVLGSQVVAGTKYFILCDQVLVTAGAEHKQAVVTLLVAPDGTASVEDIADFDVEAFAVEETEDDGLMVVGGFNVTDETLQAEIPENAQQAFDKAYEAFVGSNVEVITYMGSQVVNGTNYRFLCRVSDIQTGSAKLSLVTVYEDLEGNASFSDFTQINPMGK